jgi:hypothetical protein
MRCRKYQQNRLVGFKPTFGLFSQFAVMLGRNLIFFGQGFLQLIQCNVFIHCDCGEFSSFETSTFTTFSTISNDDFTFASQLEQVIPVT